MAVADAAITETFRVIDLTGVLANAVLGGAMARAERLDPVGFGVLAILSGLGGGLLRDALLQQGTPAALADPAYVITALAGAAIAFFVHVEGRWRDRVFPVSTPWPWAAGRPSARRRPWPAASGGCRPSCSAASPRWAAA